ncbi:hypothetical protein RIF29_26725 [Crotalaria pallida]|uniref:RNase H type-1 domain-containing protein n=1 Tax=Crotalaria pallida TaxID=3830 RepID=A0AAN9HZZ7_CROPI
MAALPTNSLRYQCHTIDVDICSRCSEAPECVLHCLRNCPGPKQLVSGSLMGFVRDRYGECMANETMTLQHIQASISILLEDMYRGFHTSVHAPVSVCYVSWQHPNDNFIALNVDGSSLGNPGHAGYGGLIRNAQGEWLCGFVGVSNNIHMELLAVLHGLQLAWNSGYRYVVC